jgi:hypothetical protein
VIEGNVSSSTTMTNVHCAWFPKASVTVYCCTVEPLPKYDPGANPRVLFVTVVHAPVPTGSVKFTCAPHELEAVATDVMFAGH